MDVPSRKRARKRTVAGQRTGQRGGVREGKKDRRTVGVAEETVLKRDDDKLRALESGAEEASDVLGC
jgi:hypothetical protein